MSWDEVCSRQIRVYGSGGNSSSRSTAAMINQLSAIEEKMTVMKKRKKETEDQRPRHDCAVNHCRSSIIIMHWESSQQQRHLSICLSNYKKLYFLSLGCFWSLWHFSSRVALILSQQRRRWWKHTNRLSVFVYCLLVPRWSPLQRCHQRRRNCPCLPLSVFSSSS